MAGSDAMIELGGEPRELKYTWKSLKRLYREHAINVFSTEQGLDIFSSPDAISALLWAGLIHVDPKLKVDQVDDWLELPRLTEISTAIGEALARDMGGTVDPTPPA